MVGDDEGPDHILYRSITKKHSKAGYTFGVLTLFLTIEVCALYSIMSTMSLVTQLLELYNNTHHKTASQIEYVTAKAVQKDRYEDWLDLWEYCHLSASSRLLELITHQAHHLSEEHIALQTLLSIYAQYQHTPPLGVEWVCQNISVTAVIIAKSSPFGFLSNAQIPESLTASQAILIAYMCSPDAAFCQETQQDIKRLLACGQLNSQKYAWLVDET